MTGLTEPNKLSLCTKGALVVKGKKENSEQGGKGLEVGH